MPIVFLFLLLSSQKANAAILFEDNFNDGNDIGWTKIGPQAEAAWRVEDGYYKARVNFPSTVDTVVGDEDWGDYIVEFDMYPKLGEDKNIDQRWTTATGFTYEIHFTNGGFDTTGGTVIHSPLINGQSYHMQLRFEGKQVTFHMNDVFMFTEINNNSNVKGKVGLRVGTGSTPSEVWFDNFKVTTLEDVDNTLAVPLLMQTSLPWADDIYDSAPNWQSNGGVTIGRIGCAITSAAMVFRYHGLTKMPDGVTELDPGALNSWMNSIADRNFRNGATNWESLSKNLSPLLADVNNASFSKLEFKIDGQDNQKLNNYLTNNNPVILNVPGHFVVAKGLDIQNNSYYINDPFYDRTSLSSYNNQYSRAITYEPASSDLSYLIFIVDLSVDIDLLDDLGNPVGLKQIEEPVNDVLQLSTNLVGPLKAIYYPKPNSGNYTLQVSSDNTSSYKLDGYIYDSADGTMLFNRLGVVGSENTDTYQISFDKDDVDQSVIANPEITFNSLLSDLNILYQLGHITKKGSYNYLSNKIEQAQGYSTTNVERSKELLQKIKQQLIDDKRRGIDVFASQYLIEQIDVLLATL